MRVFILIIIVSVFFFSCRKDCPTCEPDDEIEINESFHMYVNGVYWEPNTPSFTGAYIPSDPIVLFYSSDSIIVIKALNPERNEMVQFSAKVFQIGNYNMKLDYREIYGDTTNNDTIIAGYKTFLNTNQGFEYLYCLVDSINSQVLLTTFDTINEKVEGYFYMDLINSIPETLSIRSGHFNYSYSKMN